MNSLHFYIGGRGYGKAYNVMKRYNEARYIFNIRNKGKYVKTLGFDIRID